ncbi:hypothetical protein ABB37_06080 [Leptomonas pyrrhocoris]|uniref:RRM domain-containing protein n=1 Tax=Leptomonas pyrrhocoris TaxID=157538 RepID=A0A0M9FYB1_LEPPY|nr:hypothetical protein ABB37_06080 [Leptomonas pyrrhocoris]KPA78453.1 hypothetical protein ABB37_06080 [Leptomonas pyrrhocoris]|eukprot:XP_015656892.1 hypothetical protein ABB37_06080 [Leptomonas pyrrhocoris]
MTTDRGGLANLLVTNLAPRVDDTALRMAFERFGTIASSKVMYDNHTGESTGTAFVCFAAQAEAEEARCQMHRSEFRGRKICVRRAKTPTSSVLTDEDRFRLRKGFVRNVPLDVTAETLAECVSRYGTVLRVQLRKDSIANAADPRQIAFITFAEGGAAMAMCNALHHTLPFRSCFGVPLLCNVRQEETPSEGHSSSEDLPMGTAAPSSVVMVQAGRYRHDPYRFPFLTYLQ